MVTGLGSRRKGGRYTPPGRFRAVYGTLRPEDALAEALAWFRKHGFKDSDALPRVTAAMVTDVKRSLDLRDPAVAIALGIAVKDLLAEWEADQDAGQESFTQALGRACYEERLDCLLVPSARLAGQSNIVLFPYRLKEHGGSLVAAGLDDRLKRK